MNIDPKSETQDLPQANHAVPDYIQKYDLKVTTASHWQDDATVVGIHEVRRLINRFESENLRLQKINEELVKALERWKDLNSQLHVATFGLKELTNNLIETNKKAVTPEP